ncbi:DUF3309 domain-containing protein [Chitinimonas viridis]|nr:DUF3309 domain-containing protein [Chitinimonas viridis]
MPLRSGHGWCFWGYCQIAHSCYCLSAIWTCSCCAPPPTPPLAGCERQDGDIRHTMVARDRAVSALPHLVVSPPLRLNTALCCTAQTVWLAKLMLTVQDFKEKIMSIGTILLIIVILMLFGAIPSWPHSRGWGYGPSGGLALVVIILLVLVLTGRL